MKDQTTVFQKEAFLSTALSPAREYKDRLFRMIFKEKERFLELYNGMNGTAYNNPDDLTVTTLENAIYMGMRNDVSYLLYDHLSLYEHQASINPNMPLRDLLYVADILSNLMKDENLYSSTLARIPEPQFVVFYNGAGKMKERAMLRLSDAFIPHGSCPQTFGSGILGGHEGGPMLELKVLVLNINQGFNKKLMENCRTLKDYMLYVDRVRMYTKEMGFANAVDMAIQECIEQGILAEFLSRNKAEVKKVSIYEYDEEKHIRQEREEAMAKGVEKGELSKTITVALKKYSKGISAKETAEILEEEPALIQKIYDLKKSSEDVSAKEILETLLCEREPDWYWQ